MHGETYVEQGESPLPPRGRAPVPPPQRYTNTSSSPFRNSTGKVKKGSTSGDLLETFKGVSSNMVKSMEEERLEKSDRFKQWLQLQQSNFRFQAEKAQYETAMEVKASADRHAVANAFVSLVEHFGKLTEKLGEKHDGSGSSGQ